MGIHIPYEKLPSLPAIERQQRKERNRIHENRLPAPAPDEPESYGPLPNPKHELGDDCFDLSLV